MDPQDIKDIEQPVVSGDQEVEQNQEVQQEDQEETPENEEVQDENTDDVGEGSEEGSEIGEEGQAPEKPKSRENERIRRLAEEKKQALAEREKELTARIQAETQLAAIRQQQQNAQTEQQRRQEQERLALLAPEERQLYETQQQMAMLRNEINHMRFQQQDANDRAEFLAKARYDESYSRHVDKVEAMYRDGISRGVFASREDLHTFLLGQELKQNMAAQSAEKKGKAAKRVASVTAKPVTAKGDVAGSKSGKTLEDRLRGVPI